MNDINGKLRDVVLDNALYIPSYKQNIFSVSTTIAKGASVSLEKERKYFKASDGTMFGIEQKGRKTVVTPNKFTPNLST